MPPNWIIIITKMNRWTKMPVVYPFILKPKFWNLPDFEQQKRPTRRRRPRRNRTARYRENNYFPVPKIDRFDVKRWQFEIHSNSRLTAYTGRPSTIILPRTGSPISTRSSAVRRLDLFCSSKSCTASFEILAASFELKWISDWYNNNLHLILKYYSHCCATGMI